MLTKKDIKKELYKLGMRKDSLVLVHSSLNSLGEVKGGADTIIDTLLEVLGPKGTLAMPTFFSQDKVFNYRTSPTRLGLIPETFWRRRGVKRSLHPTHSIAAIGPLASRLLEGHEKADTGYGYGTPYKRLSDWGGYILLIGVDLDRVTSFHTVEALADAPYLTTEKAKYIDRDGNIKEISVERMAGPHRHFIGLDKRLRENGIMKVGNIGSSMCRLIDAGKMLSECLKWIKREPALMLCSNPACEDCELQRGQIKRDILKRESFQLSVSTKEIGEGLKTVLNAIRKEGIIHLELEPLSMNSKGIDLILKREKVMVSAVHIGERKIVPWNKAIFEKALKTAEILKTNRVILSFPEYPGRDEDKYIESCKKIASLGERDKKVFLIENGNLRQVKLCSIIKLLKAVDSKFLRLAYNPAHYAHEGGNPFLDIFVNQKIKDAGRYIDQIYINDGLHNQPGSYTRPGYGNAEIKELISCHRCKSFSGPLTFKAGGRKDRRLFKEYVNSFWLLLNEM